jgi:hypothetical protein
MLAYGRNTSRSSRVESLAPVSTALSCRASSLSPVRVTTSSRTFASWYAWLNSRTRSANSPPKNPMSNTRQLSADSHKESSEQGAWYVRGRARGRCARPRRPDLDGAARRGATAASGARGGARAPLLLRLGLVAHVNERAAAPAGQKRRSRPSWSARARDLARLAVVAPRVGADPRRRCPTSLGLERRRDPRVRRRLRAARDGGRRHAVGVPHPRRPYDRSGVDARRRAPGHRCGDRSG